VTASEPIRGLLPAREEWRTLGLLVAGMALFTLALAFSPIRPAILAMFVLTPLFGLPWLLFGPYDRMLFRIAVVVLGFPLAHCLAVGAGFALALSRPGFPFTSAGLDDSMAQAGALAGLVGCGLSLLLCSLCGLTRSGKRTTMALGTLLLGGVGTAALCFINGERGYLATDAIWQGVFAYILAKVLRT